MKARFYVVTHLKSHMISTHSKDLNAAHETYTTHDSPMGYGPASEMESKCTTGRLEASLKVVSRMIGNLFYTVFHAKNGVYIKPISSQASEAVSRKAVDTQLSVDGISAESDTISYEAQVDLKFNASLDSGNVRSDTFIDSVSATNINTELATIEAQTSVARVLPTIDATLNVDASEAMDCGVNTGATNQYNSSLRIWFYPEKDENDNLTIKQAFSITQKRNILEVI